MLEDLRENVLTLLEERVERAIETINRLREEKLALESENNQLRNDLDQRDVQIQNLEQRNAELNHFESEILVLRNEREQERLEVDKEKAEVRERLEGLMTMLNNVENRSESQEAAEPSPLDYTSETVDEEEQQEEEAEQPTDSRRHAVYTHNTGKTTGRRNNQAIADETVDATDEDTDDETEFA